MDCGFKRLIFIVVGVIFFPFITTSQNFSEIYSEFLEKSKEEYSSFRGECNKKYIEFLENAWSWYEGKAPIPMPKESFPLPPKPYGGNEDIPHVDINPVEIAPLDAEPQPKPLEPIREIPKPNEDFFSFDFFGQKCKVRLPDFANQKLSNCKPKSIAAGWTRLSDDGMNNTIRDCLEARIRYNLCDWAYLMFLDKLGKAYCSDPNSATLLTAFLYSQSGYQMRFAVNNDNLILLYGSKHQIFDKAYYIVDGVCFYPMGDISNSISICDAAYEGETPMSLFIDKEQLLGGEMSVERTITAKGKGEISVNSQVPNNLIDFFYSYPTSAINGNPMTRWAMYANTSLAQSTKESLYPSLRKCLDGDTKLQAANKLLNWVQTGFVYEYDDKVWGHDRAFFAEETLYYPYCDCEDRSILFSRLIKDLLGLDVALIYYPGHLATAVCFDEDVKGDAMIIKGRKFIVCDPTYIGAPVGVQMPDLEYNKAQAIVLNK